MTFDGIASGRRRRHFWVAAGKAHIEVRAARRHGTERFAHDLERALREIEGVNWAEVNAVVGRVVVSFEEGTVDPEDLISTVEELEEAHNVHRETFGFDRPDFPGDVEPVQRAIIELIADGLGAVASIAGPLLHLPSLPQDAAGVVSLFDSQPRLRQLTEDALGPFVADVGLSVTNALMQGLSRGPLGLLLDAAHRAGMLDESTARRRSWERVEPELHLDPAGSHRSPMKRTVRPVPFPRGQVERYADITGISAVLGAAAAFAFTTDLRQAASVLLAGMPKAARLGREAFSQRVGHALASNDEVVLDPAALRRLDRVNTVVIDASVLFTGRKEIDRTELATDVDPVQAQRRLRSLFDPAAPMALNRHHGWSLGPLAELRPPRTDLDALRRRFGGTPTHGLLSGKRLVAVFTVGDEVAHGWRALVDAARRAGHMVAVAGDNLDLVDRFQAHMLVDGGEGLTSSVRMLQADGCAVLLVSGPSPEALEAADCSVGLPVGNVLPWGADVIARDLGTATFLVEATSAARSVSQQSANLAVAGSATGALLGLAVPGPQAAALVMTSINVAGLVSVANGVRAGTALSRRPRPPARAAPPWHELEIDDVLSRLRRTKTGLATSSARVRLGPVTRAFDAPARFASAVAAELANPLTPVLAGGAAVSAAVGSVLDAAMVGGVTVLNALIGGTVRYQAETAVRSLDRGSQQEVTVRHGKRYEPLPAGSLVPGDVIVLSAGDSVPADCRLIEAVNLEVDESSLTGESLPVAKSATPSFSSLVSERTSMLYAETSVVAGRATAVVVAVGDDTEAAAGDFTQAAPVAVGAEARLRKLTTLSVPLAALSGAAVVGSGLLRGQPLQEPLAGAVNLAVAAVPEGLPVVTTMSQLAAARRLSRRGALVRNPRALEALARADVLCTDKTGTLTGGHIVLTSVSDGHHLWPVERLGDPGRHVVAAALRATPQPAGAVSLDTTDQAVIDGAARSGTEAALGAPGWRLRAELPFEANRGFHAVIGSVGRAHLLSVKGAPEVVLARCTRWRDGDYDQPIDERWRRSARARVEQLARRRLRLLAVAERRTRGTALDDTDVADLTFLGLLALSDPVRPTAASAVQGLQRAGVQVVMVTGDHASTAESVAAELGLLNNHRVVTGTELASLSDDQLDRSLADIAVFARVTPSDKVRIVAALQRAGRTVAMTGDGANDAPAIRLADVGLALGRHCTTAARTAADIVVTDDRIETILDAVTEGRGMWASVRDAIAILLGGNAGEVLFNTGATALTGRMPLSTRQLLLVNLMTDVVPSLAIAVQPPPKRSPAQLRAEGPERSLSAAMYGAIADRALTAAAGASAAWGIASLTGQGSRTTTVALAALVGTQLGQTITSGHGDLLVVAAALGSAGLLAAVIETPVVSQFFGCEPIGPIGWATAISCSLAATGASAVLSPAGRRASSPSEEQ